MEQILVVLTTVPAGPKGGEIAQCLVKERLAACVNLIPGVNSFYLWKGGFENEREELLLAKVRADRFDAYEARMRELHPHEVPEIVALPAARVSEAYLNWCLRQGMEPEE